MTDLICNQHCDSPWLIQHKLETNTSICREVHIRAKLQKSLLFLSLLLALSYSTYRGALSAGHFATPHFVSEWPLWGSVFSENMFLLKKLIWDESISFMEVHHALQEQNSNMHELIRQQPKVLEWSIPFQKFWRILETLYRSSRVY